MKYQTRLLARPSKHGPEELEKVVDAALASLAWEGLRIQSVWATDRGVYASAWKEAMTADEYCQLSGRTEPVDRLKKEAEVGGAFFREGSEEETRAVRLLHAGLGMCTETGEFQDDLKRHLFHAKEIDVDALVEELGDTLWYVALGCRALGVPMSEVMRRNVEKLRQRYPRGFTPTDDRGSER